MDSQGGEREVVYCHQCEEEWYREQHGLTCPSCHSEFTEIIDQNHDPRHDELHMPPDDDPPESVPPPLPPHPIRDHNPWENMAEEGEQGPQLNRMQWRSTGPRTIQITGTWVRSFPPRGTPGSRSPQPVDPFAMLSSNFATMMQSIAGAEMQGNRATLGGPSVQVRTGGGPGYTFRSTSRLSPRDANQPQPPNVPVEDLHRLLGDTLFGPVNHGHGFADPTRDRDDDHFNGGMPPINPLFGLLMPLLNPANAAHGDAVFTQEAFDRVMSQLMEQNNMGTAPGPASAETISELPKIKISKDMQDPKTGQADCSICMENVEVGGEVTRLWCGHWFHGDCVGSWLREHDSCPQCRKGLTQARDEAQGRTGANATASATANGGTAPTPHMGFGGRRRSSNRSWPNGSQQNVASGVNSPLPTMPGAFGYAEANAGEQRRRSSRHGSSSSRGGSSGEQHTPGFADRVRGLFGRGNNSDRS